MSRSPKTWKNLPDLTTPITADELNRIEEQAYKLEFEYIDLNEDGTDLAKLFYNPVDDTLNFVHKNAIQQIGEEIYIQFTNSTGATIPNGSLVGLTGVGTTVSLYNANGSTPPMYFLGMVTHDVLNGERGRITQFGRVRDIDTTSFPVGIIYADPLVAGGLTSVKPTAPNVVLPVGVVVQSAALGQAFIRPIIEQQRYYGSFVKTINASPSAINTAYPITFDTTSISNGVSIDTIQSHIKVAHSGLYVFNASFQLTATNSSIKNIKMWVRKNGIDIPHTTLVRSLESGTAVAVQSRSFSISLNADDYVEFMWASDNTGVSLDARIADTVAPFAPSAPAVTLTVNQSQQ